MVAAPLPVVVVSRVAGLAAALAAHPAAVSVALTYVPLDADEAAAASLLAGAAVVLADPPAIAPLLDACTSLRWLHSTYAGVCLCPQAAHVRY
jgi:hypothetical protein